MRKPIIFLLALLCTACKVDFDFSGLDSDPILYMNMNLAVSPGQSTSLYGFVYPIPSAAGERDFPEALYCKMNVYLNSELIWSRDDIKLHEFEGAISAPADILSPGDKLKVTVQAEGFPSAESTVTIPQRLPQLNISHTRINESKLRLSLTIEDDPRTEDCYAFQFEKGFFYEGHLQPSGVENLEPSFGSTEETAFLDLGPFDIIWEDGGKYYGIADREFNGQQKTIDINVEYPLTSPDQWKYAYYRISFFKVSPERFRYEIACQDKGNNILGFIGLAPTTFAYTNVIGGTGCLSCSTGYRTDWIAVPEMD